MKIFGLTGSIGMGKSTVAAMFARLGVPVFDADAAVRALQGPKGKALPALEALFPGTTSAAGLDRIKLGQAVFNNPTALARLEALRLWRKNKAGEIGVGSDVVMPRDLMFCLAEKNPKSREEVAAVLRETPWREERFGEEIVAVLKGCG